MVICNATLTLFFFCLFFSLFNSLSFSFPYFSTLFISIRFRSFAPLPFLTHGYARYFQRTRVMWVPGGECRNHHALCTTQNACSCTSPPPPSPQHPPPLPRTNAGTRAYGHLNRWLGAAIQPLAPSSWRGGGQRSIPSA